MISICNLAKIGFHLESKTPQTKNPFRFLVTASTDDGLLHGNLREKSGYFPATCVQEVRLRNAEGINKINRVMGRRETQQQHQQQHQQQQQSQPSLQPHFSTASRAQVKM